MNDKVRRFIGENSLLRGGDKVIVALSGGADSVSLLHVLYSDKEKYNIEIYAAHFNHGIRGAEADRDEGFCRELCKALDIPFYCGRADVPSFAAQTGESEELCGRRLRYEFLQGLAEKLGGAKIATAHNLNDNAETVLWNLTRGSGIGGLCGIPAKRDDIIRPLLCCSRAEIESYCRDKGIDYVTDSTNLSDAYTRNRLRHQVLPVLTELNTNAVENIARTSQLMREADAYLNKISTEELNKAKNKYGWDCKRLLECEPAVLKYAIKNLLSRSGAPVDSRHIGLVIEAMRDSGAAELGGGFTAVCAQGTLRIIRGAEAEALCEPAEDYIKKHGILIRVRDGEISCPDGSGADMIKDDSKIHNLLLKDGIRCDIITSDTMARGRRAGDVFTDPRRGVTKTLKKLMNELKIPRELRDGLTVIANGSTVLWLEGCGVSAQAKADPTLDGDIILIK